jgi:hypothetical protein
MSPCLAAAMAAVNGLLPIALFGLKLGCLFVNEGVTSNTQPGYYVGVGSIIDAYDSFCSILKYNI